jgi:5-methylcytosine-specific restriction endonuclease McrA
MGYEIPVIEIDGELEDIIQLFVRINSTGKALTRQEQRHAKYYQSPFLKQAARVAKRLERFFQENQIFTQGQLSRMKHIEFVCELMLSFMKGDLLNKKRALDGIMDRKSVDGRQIGRASRAVTSTLKRVRRMFPEFRATRLSKVTDFYSLAFVIWRFEQEGMILTDKRRNELAWGLLRTFMTRVDNVRRKQKEAKGVGVGQEIYRNYHMAVSQMTDDISQRRERDRILRAVLESIFARKDGQRGFSAEQRRILWNSSTNRACTTCGCKLTWEDFTIDHIDPYSKGGPTQLNNAALMCRKHNSQKGNRGPHSKAGIRRSRKLS